MKFKIIPLLLIVFIASCSPKNSTLLNGNKPVDPQLVGTWYGSEKDQQEAGVEKKWIMNRKADGTYTIKFDYITNGETENLEEFGIWWVKENKFYEKESTRKKPDTYTYEMLDKDQIKFKSINLTISTNTETYEFIDKRLKTGGKTL